MFVSLQRKAASPASAASDTSFNTSGTVEKKKKKKKKKTSFADGENGELAVKSEYYGEPVEQEVVSISLDQRRISHQTLRGCSYQRKKIPTINWFTSIFYFL